MQRGLGIVCRFSPGELRVGERLLPSPIHRAVISFDPPIDARSLCAVWDIDRPVAVSIDVHQRSWCIRIAGDVLSDPHHRRIAVAPIRAGRWEVDLRLAGRPAGELSGVVAGASPAYNLLERDAGITRMEVTTAATRAATMTGAHPDACALLASMGSLYPAWRTGWETAPDSEFVTVYRGAQPVAGATIKHDGLGCSTASRFCVIADPQIGYAGSALLDVLEAVALDRGSKRLILDGSVFLHTATIPCHRHGYVVAPPYDGDADVAVWAERELLLDPA
jgi:hypothetical protein